MDNKRIIITEDSIRKQSIVDFEIMDNKIENKTNIKKPNSMIYEMYQKYAKIGYEKDHVLTLIKRK